MERATFRFDLDLREALGTRLLPEALILQEDRNLVMSPSRVLDLEEVVEAGEVLDAAGGLPLPLGRFRVWRSRDEGPRWIYQAVVHDLSLSPSCRPGDVRRSLVGILADVTRRGLGVVATEPLGMFRSSGLTVQEMADVFDEAVFEVITRLDRPLRVVLLLDRLEQLDEVSRFLRSGLLRRASRSFHTVSDEAALVEVRHGGQRLHVRFVPGSLSGYMVTLGGTIL